MSGKRQTPLLCCIFLHVRRQLIYSTLLSVSYGINDKQMSILWSVHTHLCRSKMQSLKFSKVWLYCTCSDRRVLRSYCYSWQWRRCQRRKVWMHWRLVITTITVGSGRHWGNSRGGGHVIYHGVQPSLWQFDVRFITCHFCCFWSYSFSGLQMTTIILTATCLCILLKSIISWLIVIVIVVVNNFFIRATALP